MSGFALRLVVGFAVGTAFFAAVAWLWRERG